MKINKNIFICALLVIMLLFCINACSAEETLNETLGTDAIDEVVVADAPAEELSASGDTYVVDANGGGDYATISDAVSAATGGETIFVKNGNYTESSLSFSNSVKVVGESKGGVNIKSNGNIALLTTVYGTPGNVSFENLNFVESARTGGQGLIYLSGTGEVNFTNCLFKDLSSKYGAIQTNNAGTVTISHCTFDNVKEKSNSPGAGLMYLNSGNAALNIYDCEIKNCGYEASSGQMNALIYQYAKTGTLNIERTTIVNTTGAASSLIRSAGKVNIKDSVIANNTVSLSSAGYVGDSLFYDTYEMNIETSVIQNNSGPKLLLYKNTAADFTMNYCNVQGNTFDEGFTDAAAGDYDANANWWGSNDLPADVTATTWVVEDNGEYTLNTGDALEKDIPGLTEEPGVEYIYASPNGAGDGSSKDTPTTLENAVAIVPEGGSIFLCDGTYTINDGIVVGKSVSFIGESRDGAIVEAAGAGFLIANPENPMDDTYSVDSISFSKLTLKGNSDIIWVPVTMNELNIIDCVIEPTNAAVKVGVNLLGEPSQTTGTLNFKKNILTSTMYPILVAGGWDANINDNLFINNDAGAYAVAAQTEGVVDANYNYWGSSTPATELVIDNWVVFDATADASEIYTDESAKITMKATLNDGSSAASHLPNYPIDVALTAAGTLSQTQLVLQNGFAQVTYTSDVARNDNVKVYMITEEFTIPITVKERYLGIIYVNTTGSDDNEGSINAPVATVGKAVELALVNGGSGEIIINEGTYVGNGYHVTGDLTVTGNGKVTLDANNEGRLFYMEYGDTANKIELNNLILTNSNGYGAAVYSFANELVLDNVTIVNTQANGYLVKSNGKLTIKDSNITNSMSGNVIQQDGSGDILINNTVFEDNSIVDSTSVMAVVNINSGSGNMVIEDCKFINNTARQGVIKGNFNYNIDVKGSEFIDNTNTIAYGGAIYISGGNLDITDSVFVNNKAARSGGAIYVGYRTIANVDKCMFINNTANTMGDDYYGDAIYNGNKLTVNNSVLLGNANNFMIYNDGEDNVVNAQNNWWGTNDNPKDLNGVGYYEDDDWEEYDCPEVDVSNWVTMDASFAPADAQAGDEVTVTAVFSNANLPDGINVTFTSTSGLNTVVSTVDAQASTTYTIDANDEAINATSSEAVIEMPISESFTTNIVTNDTFYKFFDESGMLKDSVPYDELIFQGPFSDLAAGYVIITKPVTITGDDAVLNDMGVVIMSEDVALDNISFVAITPLGDLIYVGASNVDLTNLLISYIVDDDSANVINVAGDEDDPITDVNILNNSIYFENHVTSDEELVTVINLDNVEDVIIDGNDIIANYPSLYVGTYDMDYFMMGLCYVNPIRLYEASNVELTNNNIDVAVNSYKGSYPTIQALYIVGSEDILVQGNNFTMVDDLTPAGTSIYLYAVECGFSEGIEFIDNNFNISTTGGQSGAGSAYALQVATSEATFIGNNITCESNGPNLGIYSPYGFGAAKDLVIKENFINVTGSATGSGEFALISGIEIQTGYATIYNNTIYVQNKGGYADNYPVSGVSAIQYSAPTLSFDIKDNEIYVPDGKYTVEMRYAPSEATVTGNYLIAHELVGDESVYIKSGDNNLVEDNLPVPLTNIVTNDTFFSYFDENGMLLDTIEFDELIFQGEFSDLVDTIIITDEITLTSDNAVLNNIALYITGDDVTVTGFTLNENDANFTNNGGAAIYVSGDDVTLDNVSVTYNAPSEVEAKAIFANGAENFALTNSEIIFAGANPGSNHYRGLEVRNSNSAKIDNNTISAVLPAVPVDWGGSGIGQDLVLAVGIQGGNDIEFTNNRVNVNTNGGSGSYPTIDAVMVHSANDILIKGNNISHVDTTTEDSARYYYSLDIYSTTGTVEANNILVNTTAGVDRAGTAYPIQLTGPFTVTIKDNNLTAISKGPITAIYASNWAGAGTLTVENNDIYVAGYATAGGYALISGIEAEIDMLKAYNNTIAAVNGADYDDTNPVYGVSMTSEWMSGDVVADIKDNNITVDGKYAVYYAKAVNTNVTGNTLYAHELEGDDAAVIGSGNNNVIKDNLPVKPYEGIIYVNLTGDDSNVGSIDAPVATIAKAVELAQSGAGIIIIDEGTYDCPQIEITSDLDISTVGEVVLKAQDATKKAFWIKSGDVNISGVTFTNFNATYNGAVIRVDKGSSLTIDDSKFIKNGGENRQALIQVKGADLTLTNTVFEENTAHKTSTSYGNVYLTYDGDAISTLEVNNCTFVNNHNKYGAFYLGSTIATIYNSSFIGNNATSSSGGSGAAIYASGTATYVSSYSGNLMKGSASYVLLEGCDFINNTAFGGTYYAGQGGAIYVNNNVTMIINDCLFENNSVMNTTGNDKPGQGGAIYASAGKVLIEKSIFKNNDAAQGPEIYMRYYNSHLHPEEVNTLNISNSIILNDGVAIVADSTNGTYVANDNWWGTNDEPADKAVNVTVDSWAKMNATYTPEGAYEGEVTVTATFDNPNLPDGINVTFTSTSGNLDTVVAAKDAQASTTYTIDANDKELTATSTDASIVMPIIRPADITIVADPVWIGSNGTVSVSVPNATGNITIEVNGKSYEVELVDGVATKEIPAEDLVAGENAITATYNGPEFASNNATGVLFVANGVVTQDTYLYYFNQDDNGKLFDYIPEGATLDFQGSIINPDQSIIVQMNVNKPVNIVSTTEDAYVDLNTTAGSLLGESPGNSFAVTNGGSGSNVTGIYFHNTQVWIANTHNVVLDNISVVVEDQRVGSGVGATSIRENSTNVILKNSYLYTRNNGGSTTFTMSWATNCTIDNCTVKAEGNVGNLIYLNIFNIAGAPSGVPLNNNNTVSNNRIYGKEGSAISVGLMVEGQNNLIINNTLYKSSISTSFGGQNPYNNTYVGNTMTEGSGLTAQTGSIVYGNNVTGTLSTGKESIVYNNIVGKSMTVGESAVVYNNTVATTMTVGKNSVVENNTIAGAVTISGVGATFVGNNVTATVTVNSNDNVIKGNNITTTGDYAVDLKTKTGNNVTDNYLVASVYKGDRAVKSASETNIVENNTPKAEISVDAEPVWIGSDASVVVSVPGAEGPVTVEVNGTSYTVNLTDGNGSVVIPAEDLAAGENIVTVTYAGPEFAADAAEGIIRVLDGVVTQETYMYYFNQADSGYLFDYIPDGATLDFQGSIINPDQSNRIYFNVNKPVNIVTTTNDAYVDLNTTAGSLLGENPGNRFTISYNGSGTNMTGINFHNTQLWVFNTHHVVLDNISNVIEDQRVGSGVGATSVRANSTYVTVKNSYFYTRNNGGSSSLVMAWADYCTFDNNTIVVEGNVGNMIYLTTFNVQVPSGVTANVHNNITNNRIYSPNKAQAICWALVISGSDNLIENNTIEYKGVGITTQYGSSVSPNNVYRNNKMLNGSSMSVLADSIVYNNNVSGALTLAANVVAYNNTVAGKLNVNGANAVVENNTVADAVNIVKAATNITFVGNDIGNTVTVNSNGNVIKANNITTTGNYAVDLKTTTGNNVTDNLLIASALDGDDAVKYSSDTNIVENNRPFSTNIVVAVDNITVGETALINITVDDEATGTVTVIVNAKTYTAEISEGKAQIPVEDLPASDYTVAVSFDSTNINYRDAENSTVFNVAKLETAIAIEVINATLGEDATVAVTIPNATGSVKIIVNGEENTVDLVDGQANYVIEDIATGNYNVIVIYDGDKNNGAASNSTSFTVDKLVPTINVTVPTVEYSYDAVITIELPEDATGNVFVDVGSGKYYAEVENGIATVTVPNAVANATVSVRYAGDDKYEAATADDELIVTKLTTILSADDFTMAYKDGSALTVKLVDSKGNAIVGARVLVNNTKGIYKYDTDAKGIATIPVYLKPGEYSYVITYAGDSTHEAANLTTTVVVEKGDVIMTVSNMTVSYKDGTNYTVTLTDVEGNVISGVTVSVTTEGIATYRYHTDANGVASAPIKWKPGEYTFTAAFAGNSMYKAGNVSSTVIVEKAALSIDANDISMSYNDGTNFTIKLTDANGDAVSGVTVSISDGNKVYKYHTDENGIVNTPVTWKPGEYNYTVSFAGNSMYEAANITKSISISKLDAVLTAADIDMGFKDGTNFTAKLVDANGNAISGVIVKVNNTVSVYKYKTDSEGMISAPINLKPGEYEYVAFFEGNSVYNACNVTSTVKITK